MPSNTFSAGENFTIPSGVTKVTAELEGEKGKEINEPNEQVFESGDGGRVVGEISVSPGETLYIRRSPGGASPGGQNGGDSIDIRRDGTTLDDRIAVAAGGGGGGIYGKLDQFFPYNDFIGGDGGPDEGEDGQYQEDAGKGGTQTSGGEAGGAGDSGSVGGNPGSFGAGGDYTSQPNGVPAGGGGAGWYGGGSGATNPTSVGTSESDGGGGGSNYTGGLDTVTANERGTSTASFGNGSVTFTYLLPPSNVTIDTINYRSADLSWDAISSADSYNVYRGGTQIGSTSTTSFTDTDLSTLTSYSWTVRAVEDGAESEDSNSVSATTGGDAPTGLTATESGGDVTLNWTDTTTDEDGFEIHRATASGIDTSGTPIATTGANAESYTDTSVADGTEYQYRVAAVKNGDRGDDSGEVTVMVPLPEPSTPTHPTTGDDSAGYNWTANHDNGQTRVEYRRQGETDWTTYSTVSYDVEQESIGGLLNGEQYESRVVSQTPDAESASPSGSFLTTLSDVDDLTLDASIEDQFTASWPDVTNYGQYDVEYREADEGATYTDWTTVGEATTSTVITGLEDGEKYDVRVRSRTEHVTGDWFAVAAVTLLPAPTGFTWSDPSPSTIDAGWSEAADNEDGVRVYIAEETDPNPQNDAGFDAFEQVQDLSPNTEATTVSGLEQNHAYQGYVELYTEHVTAASNTATETTDVAIEPRGWQTVLTHPSGEKWSIRPDDILNVDLNREHTAMSDYAFTVPYSGSRFEYWATAATTVEHYYSGTRLFYGYLERAEGNERRGEHTLEGRDILRDLTDVPVAERFQATETKDAIATVLSQTDFDFTVVESDASGVVTDEQAQSASTTAEFSNNWNPAADQPWIIENGRLKRVPTSYFIQGEDRTDEFGESFILDGENLEGGDAIGIADPADYLEWTVTPQYTIPEDRVGLKVRDFADNIAGIEWSIDGNMCGSVIAGAETQAKGWQEYSDGGLSGGTYDGGDLEAGESVTIRVDVVGNEDADEEYFVDVLALHDKAQPHEFTTNVDANDRLPRPAPYLPLEAETVVTPVTRNVTDVRIDSTWNSVSGDQALFVTNDGGASYTPTNGDPNTQTTDQALDTVGTEIRAKVRFGGYGTQSESPTQNPNGHEITAWNVYYDADNRSVINDSRYEGSALDVLQKLHKKSGRHLIGSMDGTKSVESVPAGEVTKPADWTVQNRRPTYDLYEYANVVTVFGSRQDDGTRPVATAKDQDEIDRNGAERRKVIRRTDLETLDGVKSEARSQVVQRVNEKDVTGRLEIWPTDVKPGYAYDVDWYGDGNTSTADLERLSIQQDYSDDRAELRFERDRGNDVEIVQAKFKSATLGESL